MNLKNGTILLIDDDAIVTMVCKKTFRKYEPTLSLVSFTSGEDGLEYISANKKDVPDLIMLDINMDGIDGWQFLDEMLKINVVCDVVMFSSSIDPNDIEKAKTYKNVKDFIVKPLNQEKINHLLRHFEV
jgi:response regulator of citrate/malate metabolism